MDFIFPEKGRDGGEVDRGKEGKKEGSGQGGEKEKEREEGVRKEKDKRKRKDKGAKPAF